MVRVRMYKFETRTKKKCLFNLIRNAPCTLSHTWYLVPASYHIYLNYYVLFALRCRSQIGEIPRRVCPLAPPPSRPPPPSSRLAPSGRWLELGRQAISVGLSVCPLARAGFTGNHLHSPLLRCSNTPCSHYFCYFIREEESAAVARTSRIIVI